MVVCSGNDAGNAIALTFDDGPLSPYTEAILDALDEYGAHGTFFVRGSAVTAHTSRLVLRARDGGHEVGNHTQNHLSLADVPVEEVEAEIAQTHELLGELLGSKPAVIRPPYGLGSATVNSCASALGYRATILWNISPNDWELPSAETIVQRVLDGENPDHEEVSQHCRCLEQSPLAGAIVLLHDGCPRTGEHESRAETVKAVRTLIPRLQSLGLRLVTASQLLDEAV